MSLTLPWIVVSESFDETQMDQDLKQLRELINQIKQKHGAPYTEQ
ncbi:MAG: hypothetical protein QXN96_01065 [Candidatus Bathyarchaeia archaeon]